MEGQWVWHCHGPTEDQRRRRPTWGTVGRPRQGDMVMEEAEEERGGASPVPSPSPFVLQRPLLLEATVWESVLGVLSATGHHHHHHSFLHSPSLRLYLPPLWFDHASLSSSSSIPIGGGGGGRTSRLACVPSPSSSPPLVVEVEPTETFPQDFLGVLPLQEAEAVTLSSPLSPVASLPSPTARQWDSMERLYPSWQAARTPLLHSTTDRIVPSLSRSPPPPPRHHHGTRTSTSALFALSATSTPSPTPAIQAIMVPPPEKVEEEEKEGKRYSEGLLSLSTATSSTSCPPSPFSSLPFPPRRSHSSALSSPGPSSRERDGEEGSHRGGGGGGGGSSSRRGGRGTKTPHRPGVWRMMGSRDGAAHLLFGGEEEKQKKPHKRAESRRRTSFSVGPSHKVDEGGGGPPSPRLASPSVSTEVARTGPVEEERPHSSSGAGEGKRRRPTAAHTRVRERGSSSLTTASMPPLLPSSSSFSGGTLSSPSPSRHEEEEEEKEKASRVVVGADVLLLCIREEDVWCHGTTPEVLHASLSLLFGPYGGWGIPACGEKTPTDLKIKKKKKKKEPIPTSHTTSASAAGGVPFSESFSSRASPPAPPPLYTTTSPISPFGGLFASSPPLQRSSESPAGTSHTFLHPQQGWVDEGVGPAHPTPKGAVRTSTPPPLSASVTSFASSPPPPLQTEEEEEGGTAPPREERGEDERRDTVIHAEPPLHTPPQPETADRHEKEEEEEKAYSGSGRSWTRHGSEEDHQTPSSTLQHHIPRRGGRPSSLSFSSSSSSSCYSTSSSSTAAITTEGRSRMAICQALLYQTIFVLTQFTHPENDKEDTPKKTKQKKRTTEKEEVPQKEDAAVAVPLGHVAGAATPILLPETSAGSRDRRFSPSCPPLSDTGADGGERLTEEETKKGKRVNFRSASLLFSSPAPCPSSPLPVEERTRDPHLPHTKPVAEEEEACGGGEDVPPTPLSPPHSHAIAALPSSLPDIDARRSTSIAAPLSPLHEDPLPSAPVAPLSHRRSHTQRHTLGPESLRLSLTSFTHTSLSPPVSSVSSSSTEVEAEGEGPVTPTSSSTGRVYPVHATAQHFQKVMKEHYGLVVKAEQIIGPFHPLRCQLTHDVLTAFMAVQHGGGETAEPAPLSVAERTRDAPLEEVAPPLPPPPRRPTADNAAAVLRRTAETYASWWWRPPRHLEEVVEGRGSPPMAATASLRPTSLQEMAAAPIEKGEDDDGDEMVCQGTSSTFTFSSHSTRTHEPTLSPSPKITEAEAPPAPLLLLPLPPSSSSSTFVLDAPLQMVVQHATRVAWPSCGAASLVCGVRWVQQQSASFLLSRCATALLGCAYGVHRQLPVVLHTLEGAAAAQQERVTQLQTALHRLQHLRAILEDPASPLWGFTPSVAILYQKIQNGFQHHTRAFLRLVRAMVVQALWVTPRHVAKRKGTARQSKGEGRKGKEKEEAGEEEWVDEEEEEEEEGKKSSTTFTENPAADGTIPSTRKRSSSFLLPSPTHSHGPADRHRSGRRAPFTAAMARFKAHLHLVQEAYIHSKMDQRLCAIRRTIFLAQSAHEKEVLAFLEKDRRKKMERESFLSPPHDPTTLSSTPDEKEEEAAAAASKAPFSPSFHTTEENTCVLAPCTEEEERVAEEKRQTPNLPLVLKEGEEEEEVPYPPTTVAAGREEGSPTEREPWSPPYGSTEGWGGSFVSKTHLYASLDRSRPFSPLEDNGGKKVEEDIPREGGIPTLSSLFPPVRVDLPLPLEGKDDGEKKDGMGTPPPLLPLTKGEEEKEEKKVSSMAGAAIASLAFTPVPVPMPSECQATRVAEVVAVSSPFSPPLSAVSGDGVTPSAVVSTTTWSEADRARGSAFVDPGFPTRMHRLRVKRKGIEKQLLNVLAQLTTEIINFYVAFLADVLPGVRWRMRKGLLEMVQAVQVSSWVMAQSAVPQEHPEEEEEEEKENNNGIPRRRPSRRRRKQEKTEGTSRQEEEEASRLAPFSPFASSAGSKRFESSSGGMRDDGEWGSTSGGGRASRGGGGGRGEGGPLALPMGLEEVARPGTASSLLFTSFGAASPTAAFSSPTASSPRLTSPHHSAFPSMSSPFRSRPPMSPLLLASQMSLVSSPSHRHRSSSSSVGEGYPSSHRSTRSSLAWHSPTPTTTARRLGGGDFPSPLLSTSASRYITTPHRHWSHERESSHTHGRLAWPPPPPPPVASHETTPSTQREGKEERRRQRRGHHHHRRRSSSRERREHLRHQRALLLVLRPIETSASLLHLTTSSRLLTFVDAFRNAICEDVVRAISRTQRYRQHQQLARTLSPSGQEDEKERTPTALSLSIAPQEEEVEEAEEEEEWPHPCTEEASEPFSIPALVFTTTPPPAPLRRRSSSTSEAARQEKKAKRDDHERGAPHSLSSSSSTRASLDTSTKGKGTSTTRESAATSIASRGGERGQQEGEEDLRTRTPAQEMTHRCGSPRMRGEGRERGSAFPSHSFCFVSSSSVFSPLSTAHGRGKPEWSAAPEEAMATEDDGPSQDGGKTQPLLLPAVGPQWSARAGTSGCPPRELSLEKIPAPPPRDGPPPFLSPLRSMVGRTRGEEEEGGGGGGGGPSGVHASSLPSSPRRETTETALLPPTYSLASRTQKVLTSWVSTMPPPPPLASARAAYLHRLLAVLRGHAVGDPPPSRTKTDASVWHSFLVRSPPVAQRTHFPPSHHRPTGEEEAGAEGEGMPGSPHFSRDHASRPPPPMLQGSEKKEKGLETEGEQKWLPRETRRKRESGTRRLSRKTTAPTMTTTQRKNSVLSHRVLPLSTAPPPSSHSTAPEAQKEALEKQMTTISTGDLVLNSLDFTLRSEATLSEVEPGAEGGKRKKDPPRAAKTGLRRVLMDLLPRFQSAPADSKSSLTDLTTDPAVPMTHDAAGVALPLPPSWGEEGEEGEDRLQHRFSSEKETRPHPLDGKKTRWRGSDRCPGMHGQGGKRRRKRRRNTTTTTSSAPINAAKEDSTSIVFSPPKLSIPSSCATSHGQMSITESASASADDVDHSHRSSSSTSSAFSTSSSSSQPQKRPSFSSSLWRSRRRPQYLAAWRHSIPNAYQPHRTFLRQPTVWVLLDVIDEALLFSPFTPWLEVEVQIYKQRVEDALQYIQSTLTERTNQLANATTQSKRFLRTLQNRMAALKGTDAFSLTNELERIFWKASLTSTLLSEARNEAYEECVEKFLSGKRGK